MHLFFSLLLAFYLIQPAYSMMSEISLEIEFKKKEIEKLKAEKEKIALESSGFSPIKTKKRHLSVDSPMKQSLVKRVRLGESPVRIIFHTDTKFHVGKWAFVDPYSPATSIAVDADDKHWNTLVDNFLSEYEDCKIEKDFIAKSIKFIQENIHEMAAVSFYNRSDNLQCRHFSTLALPFYAKIFKHSKFPFRGSVYQMSSNEFNGSWRSFSGHAWNILKFKREGKESTYWVIDAYNKEYSNISESKFLKHLSVFDESGNPAPLKENAFLFPFIKATKERFDVGRHDKKNSLYENEDKQKLVARKFFIQKDRLARPLNFQIDPNL